MMKLGRIIRVAGPLVVAEEMRGSSMFDVVRVGEERLIGEIIKLDQDRAFIQVYEDTSGIKPGERVEPTGGPLCAELGPGLISSIFDGIQRPLPKIRDAVGDFVARGVEVPPLDPERKWEFQPLVKPGQELNPGDVIGCVQESMNIAHKIMVAPNLHGKLTEIQEGKFGVKDQIGFLEHQGRQIPLTMVQRWPVRIPRPYVSKLDPEVPLITGQRIADIFFPVAKGGIAAIPGGFGSGKCVSGETHVILASGELATIQELYQRYCDRGLMAFGNGGMEHAIISDQLPELISLDPDGRFVEAKPSLIYTSVSEKMVEIVTRTGRRIKITPEHKLLTITDDLDLQLKPASQLKPGDRILVPRKLRISGIKPKIDVFQVLSDEQLAKIYPGDPGFLSELRASLRKHSGNYPKLAMELGISPSSICNYARGRNTPNLLKCKQLAQLLKLELPSPKRLRSKTSSVSIRVPRELTPELAEFLGMVITDGSLRPTYLGFGNTDPVLIERFSQLAQKLFGVKGFFLESNAEYRISNSALLQLISGLIQVSPGIPKHDLVKVPRLIQLGDDEIIAGFLRGVFHGDGSLGRDYEVYFPTNSFEFANGIAYLLLRLGIFFRIDPKPSGKGYRVVISGKSQLNQFINLVDPIPQAQRTRKLIQNLSRMKSPRGNHLDSIPVDPEILRRLAKATGSTLPQLDKLGIFDYRWLYGLKVPLTRLLKLLELAEARGSRDPILDRVAKILKLSRIVLFDQVKQKMLWNRPEIVYDFTVPGYHNFLAGFGGMIARNTVFLHQLSKWSQADVIVYIGCGERGNEMTEVLEVFPELEDPRTGQKLIDRSILIANTSNMPVAAREASIYTGITIAEYYRDMGYDVALMADSTSRWAEALREIGARLEEMPGEEGFPAYLPAKIAGFYERAGRVIALGSPQRMGSVSVIGAVSPPGGDLAEPVSQATLRIISTFWWLDTSLAYRRHFPAINWLRSYSLYLDSLRDWYSKNISPDFMELRSKAMEILQREAELQEIVQLVGPDVLPESEKLILEVARSIREDLLQQHAYHEVDSFCPIQKQYLMLKSIIEFYNRSSKVIHRISVDEIRNSESRLMLSRMKFQPPERFQEYYRELISKMDSDLEKWQGSTQA